jgi:quercetin dioxygenase-like cupin family protein
VQQLNGPGGNGSSIRNAVTHELKPGDVIVIPAGVGHWFTKVDDHLRYIMIRVDPDKVTPVKDEAASKQDLGSTTPKK